MAKSDFNTRLAYLQEVQDGYPFYGELILSDDKKFKSKLLADNEVIVFPELLQQLKVKIGEIITIGNGQFKIKDIVSEDSGQVFDTGSVAPKILITSKGIESAKVLKKGSTVFYQTVFKLNKSVSEEEQQNLIELIDDNAIKVQIPKDSSDQVSRVIDYVTDFLGLTSIVALLLSYTGIFFFFISLISPKNYGLLKYCRHWDDKIEDIVVSIFCHYSVNDFRFNCFWVCKCLMSVPLEAILFEVFSISVKLEQSFLFGLEIF